jgi:hypothetical protein
MTSEEIARTHLQLSDAELAHPAPATLTALQGRVAQTDFEGMALAGPGKLAAGASRLPVVLLTQERGLRAHQVPRDANTFLVVADAGAHRVWVVPAFPQSPGKMPPPPGRARPPPEGVGAIALVTGASGADAAPADGLPPGTGRLTVTALRLDQASNTVAVEPGTPVGPPIAMPVTPPPDGRGAPAGRPAQSFLPAPGGPALPTGGPPALALQLEPQPGGVVLVRGTLAVAEPPVKAASAAVREADGQEHGVAGVVPVTLLLATLGEPPRQVDLAVPIYAGAARAGAATVGHFAVDALRGRHALPAGEHVAWGVLAGRLFGPFRFRT